MRLILLTERHEMQGVLAEFKCAFSNNFRGCRRGFDRGCTNAWGLEGLKYVLMKKCFLGPFGILLPTCFSSVPPTQIDSVLWISKESGVLWV
ncbi:hypothetical protein PGTUg99_023288 [Puccinia graminis f. sp. tritici]|uniref:Uncharacterized protein n=1 Tax=Puccinia graminis f. sp. tritici TaxID=56615 RepID=A0A5B0Q1K0_PUCGR|nr:hypothetical protein PGTUg99_023288 [Puccinia graminis f. sp. tritici]